MTHETSMTDAQWEVAARKYCEFKGLDPDERIAHGADPGPDGFVCDICLFSPRWQRALRILKEEKTQHDAINFALNDGVSK